jgi:hypothetical protein
VIATTTAVVLGLLISSVKDHFDQANRDVQALGAELTVLDRTLRLYGPDAAHARDLLARYTERVLEGTFPSNGQAPTIDDQVAEDLLNQTEQAILRLQPDPQQPDFKQQALTQVRGIVLRRQTLIAESGSAVRLQCSAQRHDGRYLAGVRRLGRNCDLSHYGNRSPVQRAHHRFQRTNPARAFRHATVTPSTTQLAQRLS